MKFTLETDIDYLFAKNGHNRNSTPDCFLVAAAPSRTGRGRERDRLLLQIHFQSGEHQLQRAEELLRLAHRHYFDTPGSVTAAARVATNAVNRYMLERNRAGGGSPLQAGLTCAVIRSSELYVIQTGPGKTLVLRQKKAEQFPERKRFLRPLGMSDKIEAHYFHTILAEGDLLWMGQIGPDYGDLHPLRGSDNYDWHESLTQLKAMTNGNAPALLCRFCAPGEQGELAAALAAGAQVAAVVESAFRTDRDAEMQTRSHSPPNPPVLQREETVDVTVDAVVAPYPQLHPALSPDGTDQLGSVPESDVLDPIGAILEPSINVEYDAVETNVSETSGLEHDEGVTNSPVFEATLESKLVHSENASERVEGLLPASIVPETDAVTANVSTSEMDGLSSDVLKPMTIPAKPVHEPSKNSLSRKQQIRARRLTPVHINARVELAMSMVRQWCLRLPLAALYFGVESGTSSLYRSLHRVTKNLLVRLMPGNEPEVQLRKSVLLWFAAGVPVLVVVLTIATYIQFGRSREFNYYLDEARGSATLARAAADAALGVPYWRQVVDWTNQAADIRRNHPEVIALHQAALGVLDTTDKVERVSVEAITADGFRSDAQLVKILARGSSVYALDEVNQAVYRAVLTTSGDYQFDPVFECHRGKVGMQSIEALVDITWLSRPNVVGQDTLLAFDPGGRLLYCTTDGTMAATVLLPPYDGWVNPVAIEAFQHRIYVLEPEENEIWVYEREDKFFADPPERYFSESAIDLSEAIDISIVQGTVFIMYSDGNITQCVRREQGSAPDCTVEMYYSDGRPGRSDDIRFDGLSTPTAMVAYAPPHSSLYLTDANTLGAYQFSLRLAYQREFRAVNENGEIAATSFAVGSGRDLFFASGNNIYVGRRR